MAEKVLQPEFGQMLSGSAALQSALFQALRIASSEQFDPDSAPDGMKNLLCDIAGRVVGQFAAKNGKAHPVQTLMLETKSSKAGSPISFDVLDDRLATIQKQTRSLVYQLLGRATGK